MPLASRASVSDTVVQTLPRVMMLARPYKSIKIVNPAVIGYDYSEFLHFVVT